jgi:hypothetical protein
MDISDFFKDPVAIATLVLALVTTVLAIGTFLTIRQNRIFREKDRKETQINEIKNWAMGIKEFSILPDVKFANIKITEERQTIENMYWVGLLDEKARHGKIVKSMANHLRDTEIKGKIDELVGEVEKVSTMLLNRDSPPLTYTPNEFGKVMDLNNKAAELIISLDEYEYRQ